MGHEDCGGVLQLSDCFLSRGILCTFLDDQLSATCLDNLGCVYFWDLGGGQCAAMKVFLCWYITYLPHCAEMLYIYANGYLRE